MIVEQNLLLLKAIAFASEKHRIQTRKDSAGTPYINHPVKVALTLAEAGEQKNTGLLVAGILHDTIEDTDTTPEEIFALFGKDVLKIVLEVTDDKTLPQEERKRIQVQQASRKSPAAKKLKLADKICNVNDMIYHPPEGWSVSRKLNYLLWAEQVLQGLRGVNFVLEDRLESLIAQGKEMLKETADL